jgi:hypothetical protein
LSKSSFLSSQLAEQYGSEVADDILKCSRSNMELGALHSEPFLGQPPQHAPLMPFHVKHDLVDRGTLDSASWIVPDNLLPNDSLYLGAFLKKRISSQDDLPSGRGSEDAYHTILHRDWTCNSFLISHSLLTTQLFQITFIPLYYLLLTRLCRVQDLKQNI